MATVMIRCPETGKALPTDLVMTKSQFETSTLENNTVNCPHCGQNHTWSKDDVWLEAGQT